VLELGLAGGHAQRALTREGACPYRHFGYRDFGSKSWKFQLTNSRVVSCDKHLGTSGVRVSEGEELNIWEEKLQSHELRGLEIVRNTTTSFGQKEVGIEALCSIT
jgi:hypothetical protein